MTIEDYEEKVKKEFFLGTEAAGVVMSQEETEVDNPCPERPHGTGIWSRDEQRYGTPDSRDVV